MNDQEVDKRIADAIRSYFDLKRDLALLKKTLEQARKETGQAIDLFYDPGRNVDHAAEILRLHHGRRDMSRLLHRAEVLAGGEGRGPLATPSKDAASAFPVKSGSSERR